jgi:hypothetical protein
VVTRTALLLTNPADLTTANRLVDVLCQADRPESMITWKRSPKVQTLLTSVSSDQTPLSHEGLDSHRDTAGRASDHLRALLSHHGLLPHLDPYLNRFETWIDDMLPPAGRQHRQNRPRCPRLAERHTGGVRVNR